MEPRHNKIDLEQREVKAVKIDMVDVDQLMNMDVLQSIVRGACHPEIPPLKAHHEVHHSKVIQINVEALRLQGLASTDLVQMVMAIRLSMTGENMGQLHQYRR